MGMIELFKEQLENESAKLAEDRGLKKRGDFLIWWYFEHLVGLVPSEIEEIYCDNHMDLGIDAIRIDDYNVVHSYSFENPHNLAKCFHSKEVDQLISGLHLIIARREAGFTNPELRARLEEIRQIVPNSYQIHLVTSGKGAQDDCGAKLNGFIAGLRAPSDEFCTWRLEDIEVLHNEFYTRSLPTVEDSHDISLEQTPYLVRSAVNDCYMFHMTGLELARLYGLYGERLLQQNIRVSQGDRATNALIRKTATGEDSERFFNYNNGVVLLAESAQYDGFTRKLTLRRFQVVNGGQTIRMIWGAHDTKRLRSNVLVPVRVITSQGDKDFANNVTVNLNNQNRIEPSFLRSNDPRVVQLAASLASLGWYFERRPNEVATMAQDDREAIEARIGGSLDERTIRLKDGMQAYAATFMRSPELAKKNPKRLFLGAEDGGQFERVFDSSLTAERVVQAHRVSTLVADYVRQFMTRKRRKERVADWKEDYATLLGGSLVDRYGAELDQVLPQSAAFLTASVFEEWTSIKGKPIDELIAILEAKEYAVLEEKLAWILEQGKTAGEGKSWPTLLKSQPFFDVLVNFMRGRNSVQNNEPAM